MNQLGLSNISKKDSRRLFYLLFRGKRNYFRTGIIIILFLLFMAIFSPMLAPYSPFEQNLDKKLEPPSLLHPLGRDQLGRDILSRLVYGSRVSLLVGISTTLISLALGIIIGGFASFKGGILDEILSRIIDILLAFPGILLALSLMAVMGPGIINLVIALSLVGWVGYARLTRAQVLSLKEREFIMAARAIGASNFRIIALHLIPNLISPLLVEASFGVASVIVAEAGLSFLGLGVQPPTPSWGAMLNDGREYILIASHLTTFPGIIIMITVLGFNFLGDSLRDIIDPKRGTKI